MLMNIPSYVSNFTDREWWYNSFITVHGEYAKLSDYSDYSDTLNGCNGNSIDRYDFYYCDPDNPDAIYQCFDGDHNDKGGNYFFGIGIHISDNNRILRRYRPNELQLMIQHSKSGHSSSPWMYKPDWGKGYFIYGDIKYYYIYMVHHSGSNIKRLTFTPDTDRISINISLDDSIFYDVRYSLFSTVYFYNVGGLLNEITNSSGTSNTALILIRDKLQITPSELHDLMQTIYLPRLKFWCVQNGTCDVKKYTNSTWNTAKDWYIKTNISQNYDDTQKRNVVNYVTEVKF